ncbi:MAG: hypothetical protein ACFCVE_04415 [Phycisphaerae bacterium]
MKTTSRRTKHAIDSARTFELTPTTVTAVFAVLSFMIPLLGLLWSAQKVRQPDRQRLGRQSESASNGRHPGYAGQAGSAAARGLSKAERRTVKRSGPPYFGTR